MDKSVDGKGHEKSAIGSSNKQLLVGRRIECGTAAIFGTKDDIERNDEGNGRRGVGLTVKQHQPPTPTRTRPNTRRMRPGRSASSLMSD
ncbi:hypothetical protein [Bradyrhizobium valentinum]|uniref:hypothetical protein n=1 Tax=Bradyrhizobium valentinum TaxID=1518501 RepID=UPI0012E347C8|nr:hypothetical protein [Bradyrhizobium valentinum]